jgi:tetratricopeptide (TPR) repeat protein
MRAYTYARQGDRARAVADANVAIRLKPDTEVYLWRANDLQLRAKAHRILGQMESALRDLRDAVSVAPNDPSANSQIASFLAVTIAKKACDLSHWRMSDATDTLAAAYAEAGDFEQAVKYEKQALNDSSIPPKEREEREKRLALFQERKPFRDQF